MRKVFLLFLGLGGRQMPQTQFISIHWRQYKGLFCRDVRLKLTYSSTYIFLEKKLVRRPTCGLHVTDVLKCGQYELSFIVLTQWADDEKKPSYLFLGINVNPRCRLFTPFHFRHFLARNASVSGSPHRSLLHRLYSYFLVSRPHSFTNISHFYPHMTLQSMIASERPWEEIQSPFW